MDNPFPGRIVQVNTHDVQGGAAKNAYQLYTRMKEMGVDSWLAVGYKSLEDPRIIMVPNEEGRPLISRIMMKMTRWLEQRRWKVNRWQLSGIPRRIANLDHEIDRALGFEDFHYPGMKVLMKKMPREGNLLHLHNLHGGYYDLRYLPRLSRLAPVVITLRDAWLLSGHCAHSFDCDRWKRGCGQCPDLTIYPAIKRDSTARNWNVKNDAYSHSQLYVVTPSQWLMNKVTESILAPAARLLRVIPNGVDQAIFTPGDKVAVRTRLGIAPDRVVLAFVANFMKEDRFKDYPTLRRVIQKMSDDKTWNRPICLLALGSKGEVEKYGQVEIRHLPFRNDPAFVADVYRSADIYIHMARAENYPTVILEALSCGTPVIASDVGGIPEQVTDGFNGFLTPTGEVDQVVKRVQQLADNPDLAERMSFNAVEDAVKRFGIEKSLDSYLDFYRDAWKDWQNCTNL